jgi:Beta-lactamase inhibitor (BLIP)
MKNLFNLGFVVLLFVVLGCNCQKIQELANQSKTTPSNSPTVANTSSSPTSSSSPSTSSSSSSGGLTKAKYDQLKNGMTYKEVVNVLGKEGEETSSSEVGKTTIRTMKWQGENYAYVFVNFTNDKMTFKSQANLK